MELELGFELRTQIFPLAKQAFCPLSHTTSPFCSGYFGARVLKIIFLGWPQTAVLPISASQEARITGVSHQYLTHIKSVKSAVYSTCATHLLGLGTLQPAQHTGPVAPCTEQYRSQIVLEPVCA
jgi:hypothetical protein